MDQDKRRFWIDVSGWAAFFFWMGTIVMTVGVAIWWFTSERISGVLSFEAIISMIAFLTVIGAEARQAIGAWKDSQERLKDKAEILSGQQQIKDDISKKMAVGNEKNQQITIETGEQTQQRVEEEADRVIENQQHETEAINKHTSTVVEQVVYKKMDETKDNLSREIAERLPNPRKGFDAELFRRQVTRSIADAEASRRYVPELNVDLPISVSLDAVGRTSAFYAQIFALHKELRKKYQDVFRLSSQDEVKQALQPVCDISEILLDDLAAINATSDDIIPFPKIHASCLELIEATVQSQHSLDILADKLAEDEPKGDASEHEKPSKRVQNKIYHLRQLQYATHKLKDFVDSNDAKLANNPCLLITGEGGIGKTHFLCDIAKRRIDHGLPTLLFLGEKLNDSDPWQQIISQLILSENLSIDEQLEELDKYAAEQNTRLLIIIDALNEGSGTEIWHRELGGFLHMAQQYTHIGIVLSVRSEYKDYTIPDGLLDSGKLIEIEHRGFTGLIDQAVRTYFSYYGIVYSLPPLQQEFQNPLFLQTLCRGLQNNGLNSIPSGLHGFTQILQFFLDSVNKQLSTKLQYNPRKNLVQGAVDALVAHMVAIESIYIPETDADKIVNDFLPNRAHNYTESLYYHLLAEGVIVTTMRDGVSSIRFLYDRFTDHILVKHLLDQHLDQEKPVESFEEKNPLGKILTHKTKFRFRYSLIPVFAIQIPENIGLELFEVAPYMMNELDDLVSAIIISLVWRNWRSGEIPPNLLAFINEHILSHKHYSDNFLGAILGVAANPNHPFNADFLHRNFITQGMAERDVWWSIFLNENYYDEDDEQTSIARLVNWAWSDIDKSSFDPESIRLMGTALVWFLSTSNRFLRDKATKALVTLFENQLPILIKVMKDFVEVNDPYVAERLYAVAYGCALRSQSCEQIKRLAQSVYEQVFQDGSPPPHILLRDYARGVIEVALHKCNDVDIPLENVRPPYVSQWVNDPPTTEELKASYGTYPDGITSEERSMRTIHHSIMGWDFGRYVVDTVEKWSNIPRTDEIPMSPRMYYDQFFDELDDRPKELWEAYDTAKVAIRKLVRDIVEKIKLELQDDSELDFESEVFQQRFADELSQGEHSQDDLEEDLEQKLVDFMKSLKNEQMTAFEAHIAPYLDVNHIHGERLPSFELEFAKRWIVNRVFALGWTIEKFGGFDSYVNSRMYGRETKKVERIGKKYQWLAYHELLARIADNFHHKGDSLGYTIEPYQGTWNHFIRDIDPSFTNTITYRDSETQCWWFNVDYNNWDDYDDNGWVKLDENLPDPSSLINVSNPLDQSEWLSFDAMFDWHEPILPIEDKYERPRKRLWYMLKSYLIKKEDKEVFLRWAKSQDFMGRWMPESHDVYEVFLGEFFWSPAYGYHRSLKVGHYDWEVAHMRDDMPCKVSVTIDEYAHEDNYDCSIEETVRLKTPSKLLVEMMQLHWKGEEGSYYNKGGHLVCFDPSVSETGPSTLLFNKEYLLEFLNKSGLEVVWTLLGEKAVIGGGITTLTEWMKISGIYSFDNGEIKGSYSTIYEARPQN